MKAFELKSDRIETENKTIRFSVDLINRINDAIGQSSQGKAEVSFSSFVIQACEYALQNMKTEQ